MLLKSLVGYVVGNKCDLVDTFTNYFSPSESYVCDLGEFSRIVYAFRLP
jgi:hypothetical protein